MNFLERKYDNHTTSFCGAFDFSRKSETKRSYIPSSAAASTNIHSVVKVFEILITFLNYTEFLPNLDRSLFMIIRKYPEVNFVKIKFHFPYFTYKWTQFSARNHYIHSVVKVFKILITFLNYPGIVRNLSRSLFMIRRQYPEVNFVKIKFHFPEFDL